VYYAGRSSEKHPLPSASSERNGSAFGKPSSVPNQPQAHRSQPLQSAIQPHPSKIQVTPNGLERRISSNELLPVFDDSENFYRVIKHDHIAYRFEVLSVLGKGSFGQVVLAMDHMNGKQVAIKIIRTEARFTRQAREEIRILEELGRLRSRNSKDPDGLDFPIVQMYEHFTFRKHICMTFELLSINLYDLLKLNKFTGLPRDRVRRISFQVLKALCFVSKAGIIHCDLKPENVLLIWPPDKMTSSGVNGSNVSANNSGPKDTGLPFDHQQDFVKLIDFGSSCFQKGPTYPYIQSRFYRAPEVLLRLGYSQPIDIWSFGCLVAELINGLPLFPGEDEADQLACIMEILGPPPTDLVQNSPNIDRFFVKYRPEKPKSSSVMNFVDNSSQSEVTLLPRYCSIHYPEGGGSPELLPGVSKRAGNVRGIPGSMSLLKAILEPRHRRFRRKDPQSMANLTSHSQFGKSPEEEAALMKDNELLLGFMLSCLTWSPSERIKPNRAIQNLWLRNFTKKHTSAMHSNFTPNLPESISTTRIRSMEVSQFAPARPSEMQNGNLEFISRTKGPKELPVLAPRRRKRLGNLFSESLLFRPTINLDLDRSTMNSTVGNGETPDTKENPNSDMAGKLSRSPPPFTKIISPGHFLGVGMDGGIGSGNNGGANINDNGANGGVAGMAINTISLSPSRSQKNFDCVGNNSDETQLLVSNKRVTLIYPNEPSDYDNRSEGKQYSSNQSTENLSIKMIHTKPVLRSRGSMPLNTTGANFSFGWNNASSTGATHFPSKSEPNKTSHSPRNSQVIIHNETGVRPFSEYFNKTESQPKPQDESARDSLSKFSGSVPYLNCANDADKTTVSWPSCRQAPPCKQNCSTSNYKSGTSNQTPQVIIKNISDQQQPHATVTSMPSSTTNYSRLFHLVRPTVPNKSSSPTNVQLHHLNSNEPRLIRISNSRPPNVIQISDDKDANGGKHNTWESQKSSNSFKSTARLDQLAPDTSPKSKAQEVVLVNQNPSTGRPDSGSKLNAYTTSVWAPQPYYQLNNVVYRRVSGSYHRGSTIEIQSYSHLTDY
ncbi:Dual specificity tyrosine-phosphorylation-regulated kinase 2, partial [Fasciolopsis buskii]